MILTALAALSLAAAAQETTVVEGWTVTQASPVACQMAARFGDHVTVSIVDPPDHKGALFIGDDRWILPPDGTKRGTVSWDNWKTSQPVEFKTVRFQDGLSVLFAMTGAEFPERLAQANEVWVKVAGMDYDTSIKVPDAAAVLAAVQQCNAALE